MARVAMLYYNFLHEHNFERKLGGVQTYLWNLARLIAAEGHRPILFQPSTKPFRANCEGLLVEGVPARRNRLRRNLKRDLYEAAVEALDPNEDLIIFGADHASVKGDFPRLISIQHGIGFDLPLTAFKASTVLFSGLEQRLRKLYEAYRNFLFLYNTQNTVFVDYNYLNWFRTLPTRLPSHRMWFIPNFVSLPEGYEPDLARHANGPVRILFARRFFDYRGSELMTRVTKRLLDRFSNIEFSFAGEGIDEQKIRAAFVNHPRVTVFSYLPERALELHSQHHIAVIPSIASEGTPFAVAEAMGAGCAVVASSVGGIVNMVIHNYNGILVYPCEEELYSAIAGLIDAPQERAALGSRAFESAYCAFSSKRWESAWRGVLKQILQEDGRRYSNNL
jgi:glycosyltransferase involved in cell wall biosynthesis